ncbi:hypothetical protein [Maliponia aquimaris]|uniref:hypothetical protein n=1 Tax=Maliponia aquimaris TaxID=1673631 RepID=UPI000B8B7031|nr:hypothetical protein [Maliponia aquimaris]
MTRSLHDTLARLLLAVALIVAPAAALVASFAGVPGQAGQPVLVVAPPWAGGAAGVVARAGGRIVGPQVAPLAVFAVFEPPLPLSDLRRAGSWAVADARRLAALCGGSADD